MTDKKIEITEDELNAKIEEAVSGLKTKNTELLGELKKARKAGEITPEQLAAVEAERDKALNDAAEAKKAATKAAKDLDTITKKLESESKFTQNLLVDNGLVAELTKAGVTNPHHLKAAQAMLRAGVQIETEGENRVAKSGGKNLADFVKEWAGSDEGKHFVSATNNSGGGAGGGKGGVAGKTMQRSAFESATPAEKASFISAGGTLTD
jgi:hypothetical protein